MTKYKLIKEQLHHPGIGEYQSYGIAVYDGKQLINRIPDISTSRSFVRKLCRQCNRLNLTPDQLSDVVLDALCQ